MQWPLRSTHAPSNSQQLAPFFASSSMDTPATPNPDAAKLRRFKRLRICLSAMFGILALGFGALWVRSCDCLDIVNGSCAGAIGIECSSLNGRLWPSDCDQMHLGWAWHSLTRRQIEQTLEADYAYLAMESLRQRALRLDPGQVKPLERRIDNYVAQVVKQLISTSQKMSDSRKLSD